MATAAAESSCIVVLVGLPGAGKTTFAKRLGKTTVSFDEVLPLDQQRALAAGADGEPQAGEWKLARRDMRDRVRGALLGGCQVVVVDDNNYYRSMRYEYHQLARELNAGFCQIYLKVSDITTALESNAKRPDATRVPDDVVRNMTERLEAPDPLSHPWESFSFAIDVETWRTDPDQLVPTVMSVIEAAGASPVAPLPDGKEAEARREAARLTTDKSVLHRVDKRLRKIVGDRIAEALSEDSEASAQTVGLAMVKVRTEVLKELKAGQDPDFCLPEGLAAQIKDSTGSASDPDIDAVLNKMFDLKLRPNQ